MGQMCGGRLTGHDPTFLILNGFIGSIYHADIWHCCPLDEPSVVFEASNQIFVDLSVGNGLRPPIGGKGDTRQASPRVTSHSHS